MKPITRAEAFELLKTAEGSFSFVLEMHPSVKYPVRACISRDTGIIYYGASI
jgi:hypothetical protein